VARPGDQIDLNVNTNRIPTSTTFNPSSAPALPAPVFRSSDFWAQGINFGIEIRY
jgi:hypothetical protein